MLWVGFDAVFLWVVDLLVGLRVVVLVELVWDSGSCCGFAGLVIFCLLYSLFNCLV